MRAIVIHQFGDPKLLRAEETPQPGVGEGEALVEVRAAGINPSDVKNIEGKMHGTTLPRIPGRDFAGVVTRGPEDWMGREVWGTGGDIGFTRDGSHAEFLIVPAAALAAKPENLPVEAAGSIGLTYVTAWSALMTAADMGPQDWVLVIGAGGGVGSAAVQIAKWRGAKIIGAVRSQAHLSTARDSGAKEIIDTSTQKLPDAVRALTGGRGADIVFDTSGLMFAESIESTAQKGRVTVISAPADGEVKFNLRSVYRKELRVIGVDTRRLDVIESGKLLVKMASGFESGAFRANVGQVFALEEAGTAYERVASGGGRAFLRMGIG
jgi:NADPH:quinone reductase